MSGSGGVRVFGDRSGFGTFCILSLLHELEIKEEKEINEFSFSVPFPLFPDQRPALSCLDTSVAALKPICNFLLRANPRAAAAAFPLCVKPQTLAKPQTLDKPQTLNPFWKEQQWIDWVLFTFTPALAGLDKLRILHLLETLENTLTASDSLSLSGSGPSLSDMLLFAALRFHRFGVCTPGGPAAAAAAAAAAGGVYLPDFPQLSRSLQQTQEAFGRAFAAAAAAAAAAPPAGGALLLSRRALSSPAAAAAAAAAAAGEEYYITTAIAYSNGPPHMGHAYEYVAADCLARFNRLNGKKVKFLTGLDEHGGKIAEAAAKAGQQPQQFVDAVALQFALLLQQLCSSHDAFVRTSGPDHRRVSQWLWDRCSSNGDIYLGTYKGWYNKREETFVSEKEAQLHNFTDPLSGNPLVQMEEESYFFRMSRYQSALVEHIKSHPEFICPQEKRREILKRLEEPLADLSCSRVSIHWGVPVPGDPRHVMYVWFDALANYLTGLEPFAAGAFALPPFWPCALHLIGKDIVWFHAVVWPALLLSAGLPLPLRVFAHGFVLGPEGVKMSKSLGNALGPERVLKLVPADSLRFFLLKEAPFGHDVRLDLGALLALHNSELANTVGNLLHRLLGLAAKFCGNKVPPRRPHLWGAPGGGPPGAPGGGPARAAMAGGGAPLDVEALRRTVEKAFAAVALREALEAVLLGVRELNKFVTSAAPWSCQEEERRQEVVRVGLECMYTLAHFLEPFLPQAMALLFQQLNAKPKLLQQLSPWLENLEPGTELKPADRVLFALLQLPDEQQQQQGERQQQQGEQQHQQGERDSSSSKASQTTSDTPTSRRDAGL